MKIQPSIGRVVWYWPREDKKDRPDGFIMHHDDEQQPCIGHVAYVWNDNLVNLDVIDHQGNHFSITSVTLNDPEQLCEPGEAEWMPYQKGQAAKTEAAEAQRGERDSRPGGETREAFIARVAHQVNKAYCEFIGDTSQPDWDDAPDWQKKSAISGVRFHVEHPDAGPEASHESWLAVKEAEGWIWGPDKDPEKKEHPCITPFNMLPPEQQAKDHLFRAVVHALI